MKRGDGGPRRLMTHSESRVIPLEGNDLAVGRIHRAGTNVIGKPSFRPTPSNWPRS